jgi:hypothetical protein
MRQTQAGTLLAVLLLVLRLAIPAYAMPGGTASKEAALAQLLGEVPICHAEAAPTPAAPEPVNKPAIPSDDCALCFVCHLASALALLPTATWVVAIPALSKATVALHPPSTGPPQPERYAARPRGPPASAV